LQHLLMPGEGEAPARAEVGDPEVELALDGAHEIDLRLQAAAAFVQVGARLRAPEVNLGDDGELRDLVHDRVQPGPADGDVHLARTIAMSDAHVFRVELKEREEV